METLAGQPRYSVVVPVYNEGANIASLFKTVRAQLPKPFELLICYDFDEDNTLAAIDALPTDEKLSEMRLVKNDMGRGVHNAIKSGMQAARSPIVIVTMADLADDYTNIEQMIELAEQGADVVCGSRYMKGGRQIGGPWLKGMMSRFAGLSLYWLCGVPTHDATNSFKAYRREFLDRTPIQSKAGFVLGLELTVKAHFRNAKVAEVPAIWRDRTEGESRFNLRKWLPIYLEWYIWAFERRIFGRENEYRKR